MVTGGKMAWFIGLKVKVVLFGFVFYLKTKKKIWMDVKIF